MEQQQTKTATQVVIGGVRYTLDSQYDQPGPEYRIITEDHRVIITDRIHRHRESMVPEPSNAWLVCLDCPNPATRDSKRYCWRCLMARLPEREFSESWQRIEREWTVKTAARMPSLFIAGLKELQSRRVSA